MQTKTIIVDGKPQGKARARTVTLRNGRVMSFTPKETVEYENFIRTSYKQQQGDYFSENQEIAVQIIAYFPIAESWTKKKKNAALAGEIRPTTKPDVDNICKSVLDALNYVAFADDKQVVDVIVRKFYSARPRIELQIREASSSVEF